MNTRTQSNKRLQQTAAFSRRKLLPLASAAEARNRYPATMPMPFEGEYSRLFSRLGVQLEPGDGFGREELLAAEQRLAAPIPEALHAYYRIAGRETV